ncbi:alpha/beta fold hydrolase [Streptomyces sp. NBC_01217]|uniref:alpha/beta fold hydrolase n=1 Tax=Streptomyces sp. NBC_01217 TaxID=2903779 RepID=UPI002E104979|nr:alpha/beta fold hydrolase [Streptomyces sp. NBC_01217]
MTTTAAEHLEVVESADGVPIACWRSGTGPPLVLVHGSGEDHSRWRPVVARLSDRFTVYAIDRRGRTASGDADSYTLRDEARDIAAVIDRAGPGADLLAHSYGAICALEATTLTKGIGRVILYEPPIPVDGSRDLSGLDTRLTELIDAGDEVRALGLFLVEVAGVSRREVDVLVRIPAFCERAPLARTLAREIEASRRYVIEPDRFRDVTLPALLLAGGDSPPELRQAVDAVGELLADSRVEVLAGQAHRAMDTAPRLFLDTVLGFLPQ